MKVRVQRTMIDTIDIDVPDNIATDITKLRDHWCNLPTQEIVVANLEWVSTDFTNAETDDELGGIS